MLILASASPRRRELLRELVGDFAVRSSGIDEELEPGPLVDATARLALRKARAVARHEPDTVVLAADTIVVIDGDVLGKPADGHEAARMLARLRGRAHEVITGGAVVRGERSATCSVVSRVIMASFGTDVIDRYVASGEPFDKAGGYAIQGLGGQLVVAVIGSYSNVVGLPLVQTRRLLETFGVMPEAYERIA